MNKFKVNISGMTCTGCEKHVESALEKIGAKNIESSYCLLYTSPSPRD